MDINKLNHLLTKEMVAIANLATSHYNSINKDNKWKKLEDKQR